MNDLLVFKGMVENATLLEKLLFLLWLPVMGLVVFMSITRQIILSLLVISGK